MRHLAVVLLSSILLAALIWRTESSVERNVLDWIPDDVLALLMVNQFPESPDFLRQTKLREWLELDFDQVDEKLNALFGTKKWPLETVLHSAWVCLHDLKRKENGSIRLGLTLILEPKANGKRILLTQIAEFAKDQFGEQDIQTEELVGQTIYRGIREGQVLFQLQKGKYLLLSNSETGWNRVNASIEGKGRVLGEKETFERIANHLGNRDDLFLYFSGIGSALPEFGYSIQIDGEEVKDRYFEPKSE